MKQKLTKLYCWIFRHDMVNLFSLNNAPNANEPPRSSWGEHKCVRCGFVEAWQYDHY